MLQANHTPQAPHIVQTPQATQAPQVTPSPQVDPSRPRPHSPSVSHSHYNPFPAELWDQIKSGVEMALEEIPKPHYAAFDADGTLWDGDITAGFLKFQIQKGFLPYKSVDSFIEKMEKDFQFKPKEDLLLWLAQIHVGVLAGELRERAEKALQAFPLYTFACQKKLIHWLQEKGVEVFIVSSSLKWALEPMAIQFNLPLEAILGTETTVLNGKIQNRGKGAIPHQQGKVTKLLDSTCDKRPVLACGNTIWDYELIGSSSHVKLAVSSQFTEDSSVRKTEKELHIKAQEEGWLHHHF